MTSLKITILLIVLFIPLRANASDEKGWYPFLANKGWYEWGGQSGSAGSTSSTGAQDQPLVQPTTQPSASSSTQSTMNAPYQTSNQQTQSGQAQSSFFK